MAVRSLLLSRNDETRFMLIDMSLTVGDKRARKAMMSNVLLENETNAYYSVRHFIRK